MFINTLEGGVSNDDKGRPDSGSVPDGVPDDDAGEESVDNGAWHGANWLPWDQDETCRMLVHAIGPMDRNEVALFLGVSNERIRQIEECALRKLGRRMLLDPRLLPKDRDDDIPGRSAMVRHHLRTWNGTERELAELLGVETHTVSNIKRRMARDAAKMAGDAAPETGDGGGDVEPRGDA